MRAKRPRVDGQCPATDTNTAMRPATPDPGRPHSAAQCLLPGIWCANKGRKEKLKKDTNEQRPPPMKPISQKLKRSFESPCLKQNVSVTTRSERPKKQSKLNSLDPQVTDDSSTFGKPEVNLWQAPVNQNKSQVCAKFFSFVGNRPQFLGTFH